MTCTLWLLGTRAITVAASMHVLEVAAVDCDRPLDAGIGVAIGEVRVDKAEGRTVSIYPIGGAIISDVDESRDDFVARVSPTFRDFTRTTQLESCAVLCKSREKPLRYGMVPTTTLSGATCIVAAVCPDGMTPTAETVHTHGQSESFKVCPVDRLIFGYLYSRGERVKKENPEEFSAEDYAGGAGYLVSPKALWHQTGVENVRRIMVAAASAH